MTRTLWCPLGPLRAKPAQLRTRQAPCGTRSVSCLVVWLSGCRVTSPLPLQSLMGFKWNGTDTLLLRVFDRDAASAADHCGYANINLDGIPVGIEQTITTDLQGMLSGTITVDLTFQKY